MPYINIETSEDDLTESQVREAFPDTHFAAADFPPSPYAEVMETDRPAFDPLSKDVVRAPSALVNGAWRQVWAVVDVSAEEAATRLQAAKDAAWERIKAERDRRKLDGGYTTGGKWFHSDTFSRTQQIGLVMLGANIPANTPWKTMDGTFAAMTQTLAGQVFGAAAAQDLATFAAAEAHRVAMEESADPAAYDFSSGWPAIYGG